MSEETSNNGNNSGMVALFGVAAVMALVLGFTAVVLAAGGDDDAGTAGGGASAPVHVSLTDFAIDPEPIAVTEGGSLHVTSDGASTHNLAIADTDLVTADIPVGGSEELDVSSLAAGSYSVSCLIAGHAEAGMTGTLEVAAAGAGGGETAAATDTTMANHEEMDYEAMSAAMNESIGQFPAETEGAGNQVLEPEILADGTKHFELTAAITEWEVAPGEIVEAWTYNGIVPGPQIFVDIGDRVEVEVINELPMATDLHIHGINVPNTMDGVAPITQDLIQPGESFTYEFTTDEVSVAMYHAHHHAQLTVPNGLLGMFYVGDLPLPEGQTIGGQPVPENVEIAQEIPMVLNDTGVIGLTLNGKSFPATAPVVGNRGDWVLITYANEGSQIHPMHLHQFDQIVIAKDGYPLNNPYTVDTLNVAPGERYSVLVELEERGTWVWHCHILSHAERETGMFGMVTAVVVE